MNESSKKHNRSFEGVVESVKMQKTIVVKVDRKKQHPKYQKYFVVSKRYHVHDEKGEYHVGDKVRFEECRPISKSKCWRVISKIK